MSSDSKFVILLTLLYKGEKYKKLVHEEDKEGLAPNRRWELEV
jgi:hypothetical protein